MFDKTLHPDCDTEGPFGVPMKDATAKAIDALLKAHPDHDNAIVKLASTSEVSTGTDRTEISKITTEAVDRDREVVIAKGIDLTHYNANPIVLLNHDWKGLPLGKALWIKDHGNGLTAKTQYAKRPAEHAGEWIPESVYSLIKQDMLPGKSIGFIPLEHRSPDKSEIAARPELKNAKRLITKAALLEYSVVGVPSNPEATVQMKAFPALASLLGMTIPPVGEDVSLADIAASVKAIQEATANLGLEAILERLKEIEAQQAGFQFAIRDIRKLALGAKTETTNRQPDSNRLYADVARLLQKTA